MSTKEYFTTSRRQCKTFSGKKVYDEKKKIKNLSNYVENLKKIISIILCFFPQQQYSEDFKGTWLGWVVSTWAVLFSYFDGNQTFSLQSHEQKKNLC